MLTINEQKITIQLERDNPERFIVFLNRAITGVVKYLVESEEIFSDADIPDHVIHLMDLKEALEMDELQLKAAGMVAKS